MFVNNNEFEFLQNWRYVIIWFKRQTLAWMILMLLHQIEFCYKQNRPVNFWLILLNWNTVIQESLAETLKIRICGSAQFSNALLLCVWTACEEELAFGSCYYLMRTVHVGLRDIKHCSFKTLSDYIPIFSVCCSLWKIYLGVICLPT